MPNLKYKQEKKVLSFDAYELQKYLTHETDNTTR